MIICKYIQYLWWFLEIIFYFVTELIFPVCLSMISNQSQGAPGLVSFCFLTTSKSETIFLGDNLLDCDYCARVSTVRCPHSGAGAGCQAEVGQCGPGSAIHQPEPGPEARMMRVLVWVRQGCSQDKNREAEPWPGDREGGLVHQGGEGAARGWGRGPREREETIGSPEPRSLSQCEAGPGTEWLSHEHTRQRRWHPGDYWDSADKYRRDFYKMNTR